MSAAEHELEAAGGLQRTLKDLFAGAVGGVAQVLLGEFVVVVVFTIPVSILTSRRPAIRYVIVAQARARWQSGNWARGC